MIQSLSTESSKEERPHLTQFRSFQVGDETCLGVIGTVYLA